MIMMSQGIVVFLLCLSELASRYNAALTGYLLNENGVVKCLAIKVHKKLKSQLKINVHFVQVQSAVFM